MVWLPPPYLLYSLNVKQIIREIMNPYAQFGIEPPVQVSPHNLVVGEKYIVICTSFGLSAELFCDSIYLSMGDVIFCSENGRKTFVFQMNDPDVFIYEIF